MWVWSNRCALSAMTVFEAFGHGVNASERMRPYFFPFAGNQFAPTQVGRRNSYEGESLEVFQRVGAFIDMPEPADIDEAKALLARFRKSPAAIEAVDDFMLDFMTLVFVVEAGEQEFENPVRKLTRLKLERLRLSETIAGR